MSRKKKAGVRIGTEEEEILLLLLLFLHFPLLFSPALYTLPHSPRTEILGKASPVSNAAIHK